MKDKKPIRIKDICTVVLLLVMMILASGCAVLNKSQIGEVNKFANAAKDYSELPGAVIKAHADIRLKRSLLYVSTYKDGKAAVGKIEKDLAENDNFAQSSLKADKALGVLKSYADLLVKLTSDTYTNSLQGSAENLGKEIDGGIQEYNKLSGTKLTSFGSIIAAAVRGVGGIYIKHKQTEVLHEAVSKADPVINEMLTSVEELLMLYLNEKDREDLGVKMPPLSGQQDDLIMREIIELKDTYEKDIVPKYEGKQPLDVVSTVAAEITAAKDAVKLAKKAIKAAEAYRKAHARLLENLEKKEDIKSMIEDVQVLADEVKAAQKIKKKIEQK